MNIRIPGRKGEINYICVIQAHVASAADTKADILFLVQI